MVLAPVGAATLLRRLAQFVFCLLFLSAGSVRSEPFSTQDILASAKRSLVEGRVLESMGTLDKAFSTASATSRPCTISTSTCRSFATISSAVCRFLAIDLILHGQNHTSGRTTSMGVDHRVLIAILPIRGGNATLPVQTETAQTPGATWRQKTEGPRHRFFSGQRTGL